MANAPSYRTNEEPVAQIHLAAELSEAIDAFFSDEWDEMEHWFKRFGPAPLGEVATTEAVLHACSLAGVRLEWDGSDVEELDGHFSMHFGMADGGEDLAYVLWGLARSWSMAFVDLVYADEAASSKERRSAICRAMEHGLGREHLCFVPDETSSVPRALKLLRQDKYRAIVLEMANYDELEKKQQAEAAAKKVKWRSPAWPREKDKH